ncbi:YusW family protein [Cytobacillus firmus]|uniref:YusW family protein n=1 Tax=Cytobacillus firmus TaxID=1399 RepID=UPI002163C33D|nr:YusW family protein [Cytobacillus firmus]MCS0655263.1 YusW family protein [Cytobacillus firmus]MCU1808083.1 YusW family protein [Cytobacillus firmus]
MNLKLIISAFLSLFLLTACNDDKVENPPENAPAENQSNETSNETAFNFTNFDLEVEYKDNKAIDVDYENEKNGMEASYQDDLADQNLTSDEAMEKLTPIFEGLSFDQNTEDQEVINQVKDAFSVEDNYQKIELEVKFPDGTEKEYSETKTQ